MGIGGSKKKQSKVLVVGLDGSGKSTLINNLKPENKKVNETFATVGFSVEKLAWSAGNVDFTMYDMSGQGRYRNLWENFYAEAEGIIYVIDSSDTVRLCVVKDELDLMLGHKDLAKRPIPVLFFANKMDVPKAITHEQVSQALKLNTITDRPWHIIQSNALDANHAGIQGGIKWLSSHLK